VLLILAFAICLFAMYSIVPYMLVLAGATLFNLSLLTSDVYAIVAAIFLFNTVVPYPCQLDG
jgi:solute carrier family 35 protein F1/2